MANEDPTTPRQCRWCHQDKTLADFPRTRGLYFWKCKACTEQTNKKWIEANREKVRGIKEAYKQRHPDRWEAARKKWAKSDRHRQQSRAWKQTNRERVNELARAAYSRGKAAFLARIQRYAEKFPERVKQFKRDAARVSDARRRAAEGEFTPEDIQKLYRQQRGRCAEPTCRILLKDGYHIDHIMPIAKGGCNRPENLQLLCPACNLRKRDKHPIEWAQLNGRLF